MQLINFFLSKDEYSSELENQLSKVDPHSQIKLNFIIAIILFNFKENKTIFNSYSQHLYQHNLL